MSLINATSLGLTSSPSFLTGSAPSDNYVPPSYTQVYAFGDSLSDAGNIYASTFHLLPAKPYYDGHFSNGPTWVEDLNQDLGLPTLTPSLLGGTDFAYGDAETGQETLHSAVPIDLPSQLTQFRSAVPAPDPNALYTLSIGSNDTLDAIADYPSSPSTAYSDIHQAVVNETNFIASLAADGAQSFLVMNVPNLGKTPEEMSQGTAVAHTASGLSALYDIELHISLAALAAQDGIDIHILNAYALINQAVVDPAAFGLTNVTQPVWTGNYDNPLSGHLNAQGSAQNGYLFFDQLHPTETGHLALASAGMTSLASPGLS